MDSAGTTANGRDPRHSERSEESRMLDCETVCAKGP